MAKPDPGRQLASHASRKQVEEFGRLARARLRAAQARAEALRRQGYLDTLAPLNRGSGSSGGSPVPSSYVPSQATAASPWQGAGQLGQLLALGMAGRHAARQDAASQQALADAFAVLLQPSQARAAAPAQAPDQTYAAPVAPVTSRDLPPPAVAAVAPTAESAAPVQPSPPPPSAGGWQQDPVVPEAGNTQYRQDPVVDKAGRVIPPEPPPRSVPGPPGMESARAFTGAALGGMPIVGPTVLAASQMQAAALQAMLDRGDYPAYEAALKRIQAEEQPIQAAHPTASTAGAVTGGVVGVAPMVAAAPEFFGAAPGMGLGLRMAAGSSSGAALGMVDAAARGEDPATAGLFGGLFGAAGPVVGQAAGGLVRKATGATAPAAPSIEALRAGGDAAAPTLRKAETIAKIISDAGVDSGGLAAGLRSGFRSLAKDATAMQAFSAEEAAAIRHVATGGAVGKSFELLGKLAPQHPLLSMLGGVLGYHAAGFPGGLATPAAGLAGRAAAAGMTRRAATAADELVRHGGQLPAAPPSPSAEAARRLATILTLGLMPGGGQR